MIIELAILFVLAGLAIGSFLNVCIDRLAPKRLLWMVDSKGERIDIEIPEELYDDDPAELYNGKDIFITGEIIRNVYSGNLHIYIKDASQIIIAEGNPAPDNAIGPDEAVNNIGKTVTISGRISGGGAKKQSLATPPSHCDNCQHKLGILDNIPIFSYLFLRGRCRYCKAKIPVRVLLVETLTAVIFLVAYWRFGLSIQFAMAIFWSCVFIIIIFMDYEHKLILNAITYPMIIIAVALLAVDSFVPGVNLFGNRLFIPANSLYSSLIVSVIVVLPFLLIAFLRPNSMGWGDVKLVVLIGLVSGFPFIMSSLLSGIVLGGIWAIGLIIKKGLKSRKDVIPYGVFLGTGAIIGILAEPYLINWILSLYQ